MQASGATKNKRKGSLVGRMRALVEECKGPKAAPTKKTSTKKISFPTVERKMLFRTNKKPRCGIWLLICMNIILMMASSTLAEDENAGEEEEKDDGAYENGDRTLIWKDLVLYIFLVPVLLQNVYALARVVNIVRTLLSTGCFKQRHNRGGYLLTGNEPSVTIQICSYNEATVIEATIDAACSVDWPREKLTVQILDDSTEEKAAFAAKERAEFWKRKGVHCQYLTRPNRHGYKAGNLKHHYGSIVGDFVAFFDADHRCEPQFLYKTVPYFFDYRGHKQDIGLVQTPWAYYNTHQNLLTECDALIMDIHHVLEQQGRANHLRCFSFNGSGGVWRKDAIRAAGGFSCDTVTEDLDLSYSAFVAGYRFVYVPELPQLLELPPNVLAYKQQKHRWNKGHLQVFRKSMQRILKCSHLPLSVRIEAFFHMTNPITSFLGFLILFLSPIVALVHGEFSQPLIIFSCFPCIPFMASGVIACYAKVSGPNQHYSTFWDRTRRLVYIPMTMCLAAGTCIYDSHAVFEGLLSNDSTFLRTPKDGGGGGQTEFDFFESQENKGCPEDEPPVSTQELQQKWRVCKELLHFAFGIYFAMYLVIVPFLDIFLWDWSTKTSSANLIPLGLIIPAAGVGVYHSHVFVGLYQSFRLPSSNAAAQKRRVKPHFMRTVAWLMAAINIYPIALIALDYVPILKEARLSVQLGQQVESNPIKYPEKDGDVHLLPGYCNWGVEGTGASSTCDGKEQGGEFCNKSQKGCEVCGGRWCTNACEPFQCPPRNDISSEEASRRSSKLCGIQAILKKRGYKANPREKKAYLERGYATYESSIWRKPESCQKLLNDDLIKSNGWSTYKRDSVPDYVRKLFNDKFSLAFLMNHKVASTSFPSYLACEYGAWTEAARDEPNGGRHVIVPVRDPVSRFVSATGEVLQRVINRFCIDHICDDSDSFFGNETLQMMKHQTSWYSLLKNPSWSSPDLLPDLIRAIVEDLKCNYDSYALDHYMSQSIFASQNAGNADPIDVIIQLENSKSELAKVGTLAHHSNYFNRCSLKKSNVATYKPKGIPSSKDISKTVNENEDIMRELCLIYIQDYICFDYELPPACADLLNPEDESPHIGTDDGTNKTNDNSNASPHIGTDNGKNKTNDNSNASPHIGTDDGTNKTNDNFTNADDTLIGCDFGDFARRFKPEELDITCDNIEELEMGDIVGTGRVRQVYEATWRGTKVAVKNTLAGGKYDLPKILLEAAVLFQLREAENIAKLVGWCNSTIILEYAPRTLKEFVLGNEKEAISVGRTLSLGLDVVKGVAELHSIAGGPISHNDIHLSQYLMNPEGRVLLGDFDKMRYNGLDLSGKKCLFRTKSSSQLSAPERMLGTNVNESADIYSVALVLWSLMAREWPYVDIFRGSDFKARIIAGERPDLSSMSDYPQEMKDLIVEAWDGNPLKRPKAFDMVKRMEEIIEHYTQWETSPVKVG